jgi:hypothetical protein
MNEKECYLPAHVAVLADNILFAFIAIHPSSQRIFEQQLPNTSQPLPWLVHCNTTQI